MPAVVFISVFILHVLFLSSVDCSCCVHGKTPSLAGLSCRDILFWSPSCEGMSGEYWVHNSTSGGDTQVYCDMETRRGGWEKVVEFQASATVPVCPFSLSPLPHNGSFLCSNGGGVVEGTIRVTGESFSEIRGSLSAFVNGDFSGFVPYLLPAGQSGGMDGYFLDGIAVMLREESSTIFRHVHSFVLGNYDNIDDTFMKITTCPGFGGASPNSVIGQHYSCTLVKSRHQLSGAEPLVMWERSPVYCSSHQGLCTTASDWFYRRLAKEYTSTSTDIVLRLMSQSPSVIALKHLTLYVR